MKRYLAAVLLLLPLMLTGCMGEDWSLCGPEENCLLRYRYHDDSGADLFAEKISTVDLLIFGEDDRFVTWITSTEEELAQFRGVNISLEPGSYKAVAWANVSPTANTNINTLEASTIEIDDGNGGIPLYYAPYVEPVTRWLPRSGNDMSLYEIVIPKKGVVERDLRFTRAHRTINVFIKGYEDPQAGQQMRVEVSHLAYAYDFFLRVDPTRRTHSSLTEIKNTPAGEIPGVSLNTPYQEIEDNINIDIHTVGGVRVCPTINLKEFLVREGAGLDPLSLHDITILVEFEGGEVKIKLAGWEDNEVGPVW